MPMRVSKQSGEYVVLPYDECMPFEIKRKRMRNESSSQFRVKKSPQALAKYRETSVLRGRRISEVKSKLGRSTLTIISRQASVNMHGDPQFRKKISRLKKLCWQRMPTEKKIKLANILKYNDERIVSRTLVKTSVKAFAKLLARRDKLGRFARAKSKEGT